MDGVHVGDFCGRDESVDSQIAVGRGAVSDADGLVGNLDMHRVGVRLGIDGHRFDVHLAAGADDAHGDFTTVGDQDLFKHDRYRNIPVPDSTTSSLPGIGSISEQAAGEPPIQSGRILNRTWPNSTGLPFSATMDVMMPRASALISFMTFMASKMQTTVSGPTSLPIST